MHQAGRLTPPPFARPVSPSSQSSSKRNIRIGTSVESNQSFPPPFASKGSPALSPRNLSGEMLPSRLSTAPVKNESSLRSPLRASTLEKDPRPVYRRRESSRRRSRGSSITSIEGSAAPNINLPPPRGREAEDVNAFMTMLDMQQIGSLEKSSESLEKFREHRDRNLRWIDSLSLKGSYNTSSTASGERR